MGHNEGQISIDKPACLIGRRHESSGTRAVDSATFGPLRRLGNNALVGRAGDDGVSVRSPHGSQPASDSRTASTYAEKCKHRLSTTVREGYRRFPNSFPVWTLFALCESMVRSGNLIPYLTLSVYFGN